MILENNVKELIDNNIDISSYGYTKLFKMYLQSKDVESKGYIFNNIKKVKVIKEEDLFEVIKYCSVYNRSYLQIKFAKDETLFNCSYLNSIQIIVSLFEEKLISLDKNNQYITQINDSYDYFDLIIYYLKSIKNLDELYYKTYEIFNFIVFNDLSVFYKTVYTFLTNSYFYSLKCNIVYEMYHFKDILFEFLLRGNNNIDSIIKEINERFIYIPTTTGSNNFIKLKQLVEVRSICCDKSVTFLYDGYQIFNFCNENNFFDYSSVSLQFFKVIEIEMKEKIINHCAFELDKQNLYYGLKEILNLGNYHYDFLERLELGKLRYILKQIKSIMYDIREEKEIEYFNEDIKIFYTRLVSLFMNVKTINFYLNILNYKVIELYRNSAVHTGLLSSDRANEAISITNIFLRNIKELNYSFKIRNILNLKLYETPSFILDIIKGEVE